VVGTYSSICALGTTLLAVAILLVVSLIPLYLTKAGDQTEGEREYKSASMNDILLRVLLLSF